MARRAALWQAEAVGALSWLMTMTVTMMTAATAAATAKAVLQVTQICQN